LLVLGGLALLGSGAFRRRRARRGDPEPPGAETGGAEPPGAETGRAEPPGADSADDGQPTTETRPLVKTGPLVKSGAGS
ncbi:hypothetical protein GA0115261_105322, partial [Streptomyces sp. OspMP-M43]